MTIFSETLHRPGLMEMPRRTAIAQAAYALPDWQGPMLLLGIGGVMLFVSGVLYFLNLVLTLVASRPAEAGVALVQYAEYPGSEYDLVAYFDCLHDRGDPVGAVRHAHQTLSPDGTVLIVEPMAGDHVEENFSPVGRVFSAASVLVCTPNALATGGLGLAT